MPRIPAHRVALVALAVLGPGLFGACAAAPPRVGYTPSGMAGNAVFFVEERADQDRQYVVLCHPSRTPPCARVAPGTIRNAAELASWVETQEQFEQRQRRAPRPVIVQRGTPARSATAPLATEDADWAVSSSVVGPPRTPGEQPPAAADPEAGTVNIITPGGWANVYDAEGHFLGQTPIQLQLRPGVQQLTLRPFGQPPGDPDPIIVDVTAGETLSVVRRLEEPTGD